MNFGIGMTSRIYADFNSGGTNGEPCWLLRYGEDFRPLDQVALELGLREGMTVTLYYADASEEFEVNAKLMDTADSAVRWQALPDWDTMRRIR
jgi:hypothetical protein